MSVTLSKKTRQEATASLERWFTEPLDDRLDEPIGNVTAQALLAFFVAQIGPTIYKRGVADTQERLQARVQDIGIDVHEDEFTYGSKADRGRHPRGPLLDDPTPMPLSRRSFLAASLPWLAACSSPLPLGPKVPAPTSDKAATVRLHASADAHGLEAYRGITDISVAYAGRWRPFVDRIQPDLVDAAYRGSSQERLIPSQAINAQAYDGPAGRKQVLWRRGDESQSRPAHVSVWRNGTPIDDAATLDAAALVAEGYGLFLLGPLWVVDRGLATRSAGSERVDGRLCDVVEVWLKPGLGRSPLDRVALCIDRDDDVTRRMRFTLEGTANTRGAVAEVDTYEHRRYAGVLWPMRSYERVLHPLRLPAHDWHVTGLDVNRGFTANDLERPAFGGLAAAPAKPV